MEARVRELDVEVAALREALAAERNRAHRLCLACESCRANGYAEHGGSPCRVHGGGESFAVGKDRDGLFFFCPNCTQRIGEGLPRWRAEAEVGRLTRELDKWQRPSDDAALDSMREQHRVSRSLASAAALINGLEHALAHTRSSNGTAR